MSVNCKLSKYLGRVFWKYWSRKNPHAIPSHVYAPITLFDLDYFSQYLITFIKGDLPVTDLKNKYEASFFFLIKY